LRTGAVAGGYTTVQTANTSDERSTDCPPTNYGSGRSSCWVSETIFRSGFGLYNHADRLILIEQGQSGSRSHRRETRPSQHARVLWAHRKPRFLGTVGWAVVLGESIQKCSSEIGPESSEQVDTQNQFGVEVYCSTHPRPPAIGFDSGLVCRDPLWLRLRWVGRFIRSPIYSSKDNLLRALNAE